MGMLEVKAAFVGGMGHDAGTLLGAAMQNERGGRDQKLTFRVMKPSGETVEITRIVPAMQNLEAAASQAGKDFAEGAGE